MKDKKKVFSTIISLTNILLYCSLVILFVAFVVPLFPENNNLLIIGWINIALVIFVNLYSLYSKFMSFREIKKSRSQMMNDGLNMSESDLLSQISIQGRFSIAFITLTLFLEILLPFSVGYITKSYLCVLCVILIYKFFMINLNETYKVPLRKIKKINKLLKEVKKELNINYRINIVPLGGVEASLGMENSQNYLYLGVELLYILNDDEIKSFFYALLSSMNKDNYRSAKKVNSYICLIDEFSRRSLFHIEAGLTFNLYRKAITYLNLIGKDNMDSILEEIKNSPYLEDYLSAKYKKSLYKLAKFYFSSSDFIDIDPENYYYSLVNIAKKKIDENKWIHSLVRKEIRGENNIELTFSEVEEKLDHKFSFADITINDGIKENIDEMIKYFPPSKREEEKAFTRDNYLVFKQALDYQKHYKDIEKKSFEAKVEYAFSQYVLGRYQEAKAICLDLINEKNNSEIAHFLLGNIYLKANSYECEGDLLYPYYKLDFYTNSRNLLEKFYLNNGDKEKIMEHGEEFIKAKQLDFVNKKDSKLLFSSEEAIKINKSNRVNSYLIEKLKANDNVSTLIMFDKYYDSHYKKFILLLLKKEDDDMIKEIEDYFYLQQEIDLNIIQLEENDKEIFEKFSDFIIFKR